MTHGPAAVLDAPERVDLGREQVLGPPDRVVRRRAAEAGIPSSGKISFISRLKPWSNSGLPQQASAKMKPPCSTNSRRFCLAAGRNSGAWWPLKKTIGAWSMSWTVAVLGSTTCQVSRCFQSRETIADEVADVVGVVVPVAGGQDGGAC